MSSLYFKYGSMNSAKSAGLLTSAHNYTETGMNVLLFKPKIDTRTTGTIKSRIGLEAECLEVDKDFNFFACLKAMRGNTIKPIKAVFVDEAQFLTKEQIKQLCNIVDELDIPVLAYGLRTDFLGNLFEGSQWLLAWADKIEELKGMCSCGKKATHVIRKDMYGEVTTSGDQVQIGAEDTYVSMCRKHYNRAINVALKPKGVAARRYA